jgi:hypothetical protein
MQTQFEIGKTYQTRFACDYDSILSMKVISRTEKTITAEVGSFGTKTLRVNTKYSNFEQVSPLGRYSMSPCIGADDLEH